MDIKKIVLYIILFYGAFAYSQLKFCELNDNSPSVSGIPTSQEFCSGSSIKILFGNTEGLNIKWYDQATEGLLLSESDIYAPSSLEVGTYTFYTEVSNKICKLKKRIPIEVVVSSSLSKSQERVVLEMCYGGELIIDPKVGAFEYNWSTEEDTETITVYDIGNYSVTYRKNEEDNCTTTKYFKVINAKGPAINRVISDGSQLKMIVEKEGEFLYSLDGKKFQESPIFENVRAGNYNFLAKESGDCGAIGSPFRYVKLF